MSNTANITEANLANFYGSEQFYRHWTRRLIYTEGVHFLEQNGAGWLVDAIASHQLNPKLNEGDLRDFQVWELKLNGKGGCTLTCKADSDKPNVVTQEIEYTDFPLDNFTLWVERGEEMTLMLPSER